MKIIKFGGACLKDSKSFLRVADIIEKELEPKTVVISAVYGVTDSLQQYLEKPSVVDIDSLINSVEKRHLEIAKNVIKNIDALKKTNEIIKSKIQKLCRLLYGVAYIQEVSETTRDLILSFGERICLPIVEGMLKSKGLKAKGFESDEIGLITDSTFGNANAILQDCEINIQKNLLPLIKKGIIPIVTGFFGINKVGKTTTFGRGGSDYSAAILAYALNANSLELWKDVNGFMSADPKIIKNASQIEKLSYEEAAELAYFGARILHPRSIEPVSKKAIPIIIKNISRPSNKGTKILEKSSIKEGIIKSIASMPNLALLKVHSSGGGYRKGLISEIATRLSKEGINICSCNTSQTCLSVLIDRNFSDKAVKALENIVGVEKIEKKDNVALVCVVGKGLSQTKGLAAKIFKAVAEQDINIELISAGASEVACNFVITQTKNNLERAVNAIHNTFFGGRK